MNLTSLNHTITLIGRIIDTRRSTVPFLKTGPQKPPCSISPVEQPFERATPESQNIPSKRIKDFLQALAGDASLNMHSIMILRNGKVICETSFGANDMRIWKSTFSACKSITSLAIGMLSDEGRLDLDEKVINIFDKHATPLLRVKLANLTVRDLLTMTSGIVFNEAISMTETDWVKSFLNSTMKGEIGKTFNYNSLNTYMLSAIIRQITGEGLTEYLEKRLFKPLGITNVFWEKCPKGIEKGGWGLYIRMEDMAKLGQLVLQKGKWNGEQLISEEYIAEATKPHMDAPESYGDFNYGYQIWVGRKLNTFLFNGMFGQNVLCFRDNGIIVVTNAGNDEMFQQSNYFRLVQQYFSEAFIKDLKPDPKASEEFSEYLKLLKTTAVLRPRKLSGIKRLTGRALPLPPECYDLNGKSYITKDENAGSTGLLPIALQTVQNNYTQGVDSISFEIKDERFYLEYREKDESYRFEVGFDKSIISDISFHGEQYRISIGARFTTDEDDRLVLKIELLFLETFSTRTLKLFFHGDKMTLLQSERPGREFVIQYLADIKYDLEDKPVFRTAINRFGTDYLDYKIERLFFPKIIFDQDTNSIN